MDGQERHVKLNRLFQLLRPKKHNLLWEWALGRRFLVQESPNKANPLWGGHSQVCFPPDAQSNFQNKQENHVPSNWPYFSAVRAKGTQRCTHAAQLGPQHTSRTAGEGLKGSTETYPKAAQGTVKGFQSSQSVTEPKSQQKHLPIAYIFHSPVKPVTGPLPLAELWIYQEQTSVATVYWDHPSAAENASMHSVNIRRSGVTCSYQLTKSTSTQPEWKVILRYCAIHWQGTAPDRTKSAEGDSLIPALLRLQKSSRSLR